MRRFNRKLFSKTEIELNDMAAPAIIGLSKKPKAGYKIPAATGIATRLYMNAQKRFWFIVRIVAFDKSMAFAIWLRSECISVIPELTSAFHGYICSATHSDPNIGLCQSVRIIDPDVYEETDIACMSSKIQRTLTAYGVVTRHQKPPLVELVFRSLACKSTKGLKIIRRKKNDIELSQREM